MAVLKYEKNFYSRKHQKVETIIAVVLMVWNTLDILKLENLEESDNIRSSCGPMLRDPILRSGTGYWNPELDRFIMQGRKNSDPNETPDSMI